MLSVFALSRAFGAAPVVGIVAVPLPAVALFLGYRAAPSPRPVSRRTVGAPGRRRQRRRGGCGPRGGHRDVRDRPESVPAAIALVADLRFVPLARLYDQWQHKVTAALLSAAAVAGSVAMGVSDESVRAVVGLSCALVPWASACHVAVEG